jgi:hypothetical protein
MEKRIEGRAQRRKKMKERKKLGKMKEKEKK